MKIILTLLISLLLSACATTQTAQPHITPAGLSLLKQAETVLPQFYGKYSVKNSRINNFKVDTLTFEPIAGIPTLVLYNKGGAVKFQSAVMNECSGWDVQMNDGSKSVSLYCNNTRTGTRGYTMISFSTQDKAKEITSGSMIKAFQPMVVEKDGYYLEYNSGDSRINSHFSLVKME